MIETRSSYERGLVAVPPARRYAAGVIAQYIHELSERHAEEARRGRESDLDQ